MRHLITLAATAAVLATAATSVAQSANTNKSDPDRKVCRTYAEIGTRIKKRICRTAAEWDQMRRDGQEYGRQMQEGINSERPVGS